MRILVAGGRNYSDSETVKRVLDTYKPSEIAQGGASGADREAALWAHDNDVPCATYPAAWEKHGRAAGPIRNAWMLDDFKPDLVILFPGGRGTDDMRRKAAAAGYEWISIP